MPTDMRVGHGFEGDDLRIVSAQPVEGIKDSRSVDESSSGYQTPGLVEDRATDLDGLVGSDVDRLGSSRFHLRRFRSPTFDRRFFGGGRGRVLHLGFRWSVHRCLSARPPVV
jgi:hypothetical protein